MTKGKKHKSRKFEQYYGEPYKPKGKRKREETNNAKSN
jgi:hypothetical protein